MSRYYKPGDIVGNFEIIEKTGSYLETNGTRQGLYRVRCLTCAGKLHLVAATIRTKKDCGCSRRKNQYKDWKRKTLVKKTRIPWMSDSEIYAHWKGLRDRDLGYSILAELNDVPVKQIVEIIRRQEEEQIDSGRN